MKAVTSSIASASIALLALVELGESLKWLCVPPETPYFALNDFLIHSTNSSSLEKNAKSINRLLENELEFNKRSEGFKRVAERLALFRNRVKKDIPRFCSVGHLYVLRELVDEAHEWDQNFLLPPRNSLRLNSLLVGLLDRACSKCYKYLQDQWNELDKKNEEIAALLEAPAIVYFNSNIPYDHVFKRFIYTPKRTPRATKLKDKRRFAAFIRDALLESQKDLADKPLSSPRLTRTTFRKYLSEYLTEPCERLVEKDEIYRTLEATLQLLKMKVRFVPDDKDVNNLGQNLQSIDSMPAYLMCIETYLMDQFKFEKLSNTIYKLLLRAARRAKIDGRKRQER